MYSFVTLVLLLVTSVGRYGIVNAEDCAKCKCGDHRFFEGIAWSIADWEVPYRNEFPWIVQIYHGNELQCGGSLINAKWVLTAAHCLQVHLEQILVHILAYERNDKKALIRKVAQIKAHENFNTPPYANDIGLVQLEEAVPLGDELNKATTVCFPPSPLEHYDGHRAHVMGWGHNDSSNNLPNKLREAETIIIPTSECQERYAKENVADRFSSNVICTGLTTEPKYVCKGDSGGPLTVTIDGREAIMGIVSWGRGECGKNNSLPMVYTRVDSYIGWIKSWIIKECYCEPINGTNLIY